MAEKAVSLEVGDSIRLEQVSGNVHHCINVKLIGYADGQCLIVSLPETIVALNEGDEMIARIKHQGEVIAFSTKVLKLKKKPYEYMHLHYPMGVKGKQVPRDTRVPVKPRSIRLTMLDGDEAIQVDLADLSINGARLTAPKRLGYIDDKFMIDMNIPYTDTVITLPCMIRHIQNDLSVEDASISTSYHHGVKFDGLSEEATRFIESFIAENGKSQHRLNS